MIRLTLAALLLAGTARAEPLPSVGGVSCIAGDPLSKSHCVGPVTTDIPESGILAGIRADAQRQQDQIDRIEKLLKAICAHTAHVIPPTECEGQ